MEVTISADAPAMQCEKKKYSDRVSTYPNNLKKYRIAARLKLQTVCTKIGISLGYLSQIERGQSLPALDVAFRLAKFYGTSVDAIWRISDGDGRNQPAGEVATDGDSTGGEKVVGGDAEPT